MQDTKAMALLAVKAAAYEHQIKAFELACGLFGLGEQKAINACALLMEMGTGKTFTAIAIVGALLGANKIKRVLIVSPLSVTTVWEAEFSKFAAFEYNLKILKGNSAKKTEILKNTALQGLQIVVVNYESLWRIEREIVDWKADLIIADESHKIKVHSTNVSKSMHRLGAKSKYRLLLTGTPITNKIIDIFSQYKFLNPNVFGHSFYRFRNRYFWMEGYGGYTLVLKKHMEAELIEKIHSIAFRVTKADCLDLPEITENMRFVELEEAAAKIYRNLLKDSYAAFEKGEITVTNILTRLLRLSQLTGGFIKNDDSGSIIQISKAKLIALEDIIENALNEDKKLVIIARFIPEINAICAMLNEKSISYSAIFGAVKNRDEQVNEFQNNPNTRVFVGQIATAGLGITLTASSVMVFYSLDYSIANFEQSKARIHRAGQKENCSYLYLIAKGTLDEIVLAALRDKADMAKALIDSYKNGGNFF